VTKKFLSTLELTCDLFLSKLGRKGIKPYYFIVLILCEAWQLGHNLASWKLLEDMMLELKKSGVTIPGKVVEDLRSAKSMIQLTKTEGSHGDVLQKAEEYLANVEAYVVTEGQQVFGLDKVDEWLRRLEEANAQVCDDEVVCDKFVTGVPRDQKWVRVEPMGDLTAVKVQKLAVAHGMQVKVQADGRLVVYGSAENLKVFLKALAPEKTNAK
jgi:hypothetical protein